MPRHLKRFESIVKPFTDRPKTIEARSYNTIDSECQARTQTINCHIAERQLLVLFPSKIPVGPVKKTILGLILRQVFRGLQLCKATDVKVLRRPPACSACPPFARMRLGRCAV